MPQTVGLAVLAGVVSSALFLCLLTGVPGMVLLAYFVQLPLVFAGLAMGLTASMVAVAGALLINGLIAGAVATAIYAVVQALPALIVVRQALLSRQQDGAVVEWYPPGRLLAILTGLAGAGVALAYLMLLDHPGGLQGAIEEFLMAALADLGAVEVQAVPPPELSTWMFLFPGLMATSWLTMIVLNAILAQALATTARLEPAAEPRSDLARAADLAVAGTRRRRADRAAGRSRLGVPGPLAADRVRRAVRVLGPGGDPHAGAPLVAPGLAAGGGLWRADAARLADPGGAAAGLC